MLSAFLNGTENKNAALRLREMVSVLRKHDIVHGFTPIKLRAIFEDLGPTFVKFGQIMSMRPDFLPTEYCDELMKLQTGANPLPFPMILAIVEQEYHREWNRIFHHRKHPTRLCEHRSGTPRDTNLWRRCCHQGTTARYS